MPASTENSTTPRTTAAPRTVSGRKKTLFRLAALSLPIVAIAVAELLLRLFGVAASVSYEDPLVGFSEVSPLFELDGERGVYETARSRRMFFGTQEFDAEKPDGEFRVFCLGGSTVRGRPYETPTAFARWVELELNARLPERSARVVNCGGLSYASYRLTKILEEVLQYKPDLIVVSTGHNEFLEDRTYHDIKSRSGLRAWIEDRLHASRVVRVLRQWRAAGNDEKSSDARTVLPDQVDTRLDHDSGYASYHRDDAWQAGVIVHYEQSLRAMVDICRTARVPLVLVRLGSNVRDCPPYKSEHRPNLSPEDQRRWQAQFDEAGELDEEQPEQALEKYRQAEEIDGEYALLRFRIARCLDDLGQIDAAREHYLAAKDFDVCPLRMLEEMTDIVTRVANETSTPLVDARGAIEEVAWDRLPGNDWYMDHVHPSIGSHQRIAREIVRVLQHEQLIDGMQPWNDEDRRAAYEAHLESLGPNYIRDGYERVGWLEGWAQRHRLSQEMGPRDPLGRLRYGFRLWDFDLREQACWDFAAALDEDPELALTLGERVRELSDQGRSSSAEDLLNWMNETIEGR